MIMIIIPIKYKTTELSNTDNYNNNNNNNTPPVRKEGSGCAPEGRQPRQADCAPPPERGCKHPCIPVCAYDI